MAQEVSAANDLSATRETPFQDPWERGLILILLVMFAALAAMPVYMIPVHVARNYNEGWNAYQAAMAMGAGPLYPPMDALTANNYPPFSFYIVGLFGKVIGDFVVAGRIISVLALLITAWNVFHLCRWLSTDISLSLIGAGWFLLAIYTLRPGYIAMDDPQFLAQALVTSGAVLFLRAAPGRLFRGLFLSAFLIIAGGLVKHNVVALSLALCTWAAFHDRRRLGLFLLALIAIGAVELYALDQIWGRLLFENVMLHARRTAWRKSLAMSLQVLPFLLLYLIITLAACFLGRQRNQSSLVLAFLFWSAGTGFWWLSGAGVTYSILFDMIMALALGGVAFCLALSQSDGMSPFRISRRVSTTVLVLSLVAFNLHDRRHPFAADMNILLHEKEWATLNDQLEQATGPVACEILAACYWAHKPFEIDFFNYGEKLMTGSISDEKFRNLIGSHYYAYILIEKSSLETPQLPEESMDWLMSHYQPVRLVDGHALLLAPAP